MIGKRVRLRRLAREDLVYLQRWSQDADIRALIGEAASMSEADSGTFLEKVRADTERAWFVVAVREE